jgi:hypothetical protein
MRCAQSATEIRPGAGVCRKAVVNVNSAELKRVLNAKCQQNVQEHDRIHPARQGQRQPRVRGHVAYEPGRHHADDSLIWQALP